jgi:hypothetical protein
MGTILADLMVETCGRPGLMVCGPPALVTDVRTHLRKDSRYARVAVYEETFEL